MYNSLLLLLKIMFMFQNMDIDIDLFDSYFNGPLQNNKGNSDTVAAFTGPDPTVVLQVSEHS